MSVLLRRARNVAKSMIERARKGAKKRNLEFTIAEGDISPLPEYCPVLGIKLDYFSEGRVHAANCASLDRMDNSKGYVVGNVQVISYRANSLKSNATIDEIRAILSYMENDAIATRMIALGRYRPPCRKCGGYDRNRSNQCRPCRAAARAARARHFRAPSTESHEERDHEPKADCVYEIPHLR
jgi:hypothetical protein